MSEAEHYRDEATVAYLLLMFTLLFFGVLWGFSLLFGNGRFNVNTYGEGWLETTAFIALSIYCFYRADKL